jgi:hypothetical protein
MIAQLDCFAGARNDKPFSRRGFRSRSRKYRFHHPELRPPVRSGGDREGRRPQRFGRILRGPPRDPIARLRDGCPARPPQDDKRTLGRAVIARSECDEAIQSE